MCEFQTLYFEDDGYVVRCKQCGHYQLGFGTIMFTLPGNEFREFCKTVKHKCTEAECIASPHKKKVILQTPSPGICLLLTHFENRHFSKILDQADSEEKALEIMNLFNPG